MILQQLIEYSNSVINDLQHHCAKHRAACKRFLSDLEKSSTEDFQFYFDEASAEKFCFEFVQLFRHTKGVLSGQKKVFTPIENFIFGNIYGWKNKKTGLRRFTKMYWQVARKNSKSMDMALMALYELFFFLKPYEISEVYCAATKTEQSKLIYQEAIALLRTCPAFAKKYKVAYGRITRTDNSSWMRALSKDDGRSGDGLNAQAVCLDEYHAHKTTELYDVLCNSQGSRSQPIFAVITTAGHDLNAPAFRVEYDICSKILAGTATLDHYFVMINELDKNQEGILIDDVKNKDIWVKANPIVCSYTNGVAQLTNAYKEAVEQPEKMVEFLTKRMNVWVHQPQSSYLNMDKWALCKGELPHNIHELPCYCGIDLSAKIDLTSVAFEFVNAEKFYVLSHSFMPEETLVLRRQRDKAPYDAWVSDGYITLCKGSAIDYLTIWEWIENAITINGYNVKKFCIDPWGSQLIKNRIATAGFDFEDVVQGIKTLSEPTKHFREMVYQKRILHDGNPVLTWALSNAVADSVDRNENILLSKKKSTGRIDPIAALINAHVHAQKELYITQESSKVFFL